MKKKKISSNTYLVSSNDDYFDDCPICQAMRQAEKEGKALSESKLARAFEKSKDAGWIVGIPSFDEKKPIN